ncbi:MAG: LytTR family DNA-binding domain-containing protein [Thermoflexibacter sp.]|jgi:DNA-binding LytR/AlgR family response regulator|nr:LytTR family DNA-binding domain-containing protein [Thermoflexibacter sp.]
MNITCIIVEDEPLARNLLEQYIKKVPYLQLVNTFSNPLSAIEFLRENSIDLLFLDIQMPEITGVNLLKILTSKPLVIFTTAYSEYALEGYELDVVDYLLKPITLERFLKSVEKVAQRLSSKAVETEENINKNAEYEPSPNFVFVKDGTKLVKIRLQDILYIEGLKDYVIIHTPQQKVVSLQRMKNLEEQLPNHQFVRIHNSYIVSLEAIDAIEKEKVQVGKVFLPISDGYRKSFKEFIEQKNIKLD